MIVFTKSMGGLIMKKLVIFIGVLLTGVTIGAATGSKITAELKSQKVNYNGSLSNQQVISYNGSTYVPLRSFGELVDIPVSYSSGVVYMGEDKSNNVDYWKKDINIMAKDIYTVVENEYNGKVYKNNIGNKYTNYLIFSTTSRSGYVTFPLSGKYKTFEATFAVPDGKQDRIDGTFKILLDDKEVYTKEYSPNDMPEDISIDISGAQKISFVIDGESFLVADVGLYNGKFIK